MRSIASVAQEHSVSGSSGLDSIRLPSARAIQLASAYCDTTGHLSQSTPTSTSSQQIDWVGPSTSSLGASLANHIAPRPEEGTSPETSGLSSCESSESSDRLGWQLRTSLESDMTALTGCVVILSAKTTPSGRSISTLRYRRDSVAAFVSSGWPTPTETANHDAPSMRKWPAYARYQDAVKRTTARLWEWMMDFPDGWTACICSETRSPQQSLSSSDGQS